MPQGEVAAQGQGGVDPQAAQEVGRDGGRGVDGDRLNHALDGCAPEGVHGQGLEGELDEGRPLQPPGGRGCEGVEGVRGRGKGGKRPCFGGLWWEGVGG